MGITDIYNDSGDDATNSISDDRSVIDCCPTNEGGTDDVRTYPRGGTLLSTASRGRLRLRGTGLAELKDEAAVRDRFASGPDFERDMSALGKLYEQHKNTLLIQNKRELWRDLLTTGLGEAAEKEPNIESLFLKHTYLAALVNLAVQNAFGVDITKHAALNPVMLLSGHLFVEGTGVRGIVESDLFVWPAEVDLDAGWVSDLAGRIAYYDWGNVDYDFVRVLYQSVIPADDRRRLGEYYTPDWLSEAIVNEVLPYPLYKRVLDPACGSGTFLRAVIRKYVTAAQEEGWSSKRILDGLMQSVIGVDVHPISVHLARANWVLSAREIILDAASQVREITVPVYLGDSLQVFAGTLWNEEQLTVPSHFAELSTEEGRVDVIVGNPPWSTYSRTREDLRVVLKNQSRNLYNIWQGGKFAPHQDIAGFFYTRCVDLYLKHGGKIGMVLPHSALQSGQYAKWRSGEWGAVEVDMNHYISWDLEKISPNTFFPVPACVIFSIKADKCRRSAPLKNQALLWVGPPGGPFEHEMINLCDFSRGEYASPYGARAFQGATFGPRVMLFVEVSKSSADLTKGVCNIRPRRSSKEKPPWKDISSSLDSLSGVIESKHIYSVYTGKTVAPFLLLDPIMMVLPMASRRAGIDYSDGIVSIGGVDSRSLGTNMRARWEDMCKLWDNNNTPDNKLSLIERIDYMNKLSNQIPATPIRILYTAAGIPTATAVTDSDALVDTTLYWIQCHSIDEAYYLSAIINSETIRVRSDLLMSKGAYGPRNLHKHLWRLSIPKFDQDDSWHIELASLGSKLHSQAQSRWKEETTERAAERKTVSVTVARRVLREWLTTNQNAQRVEDIVKRFVLGR